MNKEIHATIKRELTSYWRGVESTCLTFSLPKHEILWDWLIGVYGQTVANEFMRLERDRG